MSTSELGGDFNNRNRHADVRHSAGERGNSPWRISQAVQHVKFGEGVIVNIEGGGADMRVQVNFRGSGTKWLALEYAKLTAL